MSQQVPQLHYYVERKKKKKPNLIYFTPITPANFTYGDEVSHSLSPCAVLFIPYPLITSPLRCLNIKAQIRSVSCLCAPRFSIILSISSVCDQILQKADVSINLPAKKLGQPFPEVHADSLQSSRKSRRWCTWTEPLCPPVLLPSLLPSNLPIT